MKVFFILILAVMIIQIFPGTVKEEILILGSDKVEEELYIPLDMKIGPDGDIYAFDKKDLSIKVYSSTTGQFLRKISGVGQAPGEYIGFGGFGFSNDKKLFFLEGPNGHPWITYMELSGKHDRILKIQKKPNLGFNKVTMLSDGRIVAGYYCYGAPGKKKGFYVENYVSSIVIVDQTGQISQMVIEKILPFRISDTPQNPSKMIPFFPKFLWDITPDNRLVFTQGNSNILEVYNLQGKLMGKIKTPLQEAPKVTSQDLNEWKEKTRSKIVKEIGNEAFSSKFSAIMRYNESFYERKPIIDSISVTPSDNILICEEKPVEAKENTYYLVSFKGDSLAKIITRAYNITISKDFIIYVIDDEEENPFVYCMKRKGTEKDDLLRLNNK